jgi:ATP-dependent DNA helicase RecG
MRPAELGSFSVERRGVDWSAVATAASLDDVAPGALAQLRAWLRESSERSRLDLATSADRACCTSLVSPTSRVGSTAPASCSASGSPGERPHRPHVSAAAGAETELRLDDPEQPLAVAPAAVEDAIALHNPQYRLPGRLARGLTRALPELALREALVNAIAHRDWSAPGPVRVQLEGLILTVSSPGGFLPGVTAETVITAPPRTRNAQLARALRSLRLAEAEGIGVDRMFREAIRQGLPAPEIAELPGGAGVRCVLIGGAPDPAVSAVVASLGVPAEQDVDVLLVLYMLEQRATINATALAPVIQKSHSEATAALGRALGAGLVVEAARKGHVRLADTAREQLRSRLPYLRRSQDEYAVVIAELLADHGEVRARDLMDACSISQTQASRALAQATANGLLVRHGGTGAHVFYTAP